MRSFRGVASHNSLTSRKVEELNPQSMQPGRSTREEAVVPVKRGTFAPQLELYSLSAINVSFRA